MDKSDASCVVSGSLALVLRSSRGLAMSPLSAMRSRSGWRVTPSRTLAAFQRRLFTAFNTLAVAGVVWEFCEEPKNRVRLGGSVLREIVFISDFLLMMTTASIAIYMGPSRMANLIQMLKKLQQINFELKIKPPSAKSERMSSFVIICYLVLSIILQLMDIEYLVHSAYYDSKLWQVMGPYVGYYYCNIVLVMVGLQWFCIARAAYTASAELNRQLQQLRYAHYKSESKVTLNELTAAQSVCTLVDSFTIQHNSDTGIPMFLSQAQEQIRRLALSYDLISELVVQLTTYNNVIILLIVFANSLRLVISPYYLLLNILGVNCSFGNTSLHWPYTVLQIIWIVYFIVNLMLIAEPCQWTQDQREHTQLLLSQLTLHLAPRCERLASELDRFNKHVQLNNAKFVPGGVFTLSRPLIVTILGSATTYLLIILQFQNISDHL